MQKELFQVQFLESRDAHWKRVQLINQTRPNGPAAYKYGLTGHQFNMDFLGIKRPYFDFWSNQYKNEGSSFTTDAYIPGPLVELGFSIKNIGTLDLKNIGTVKLNPLQYFLTALPYVESKVTTDKNSRGLTLDFYFKLDYLESICHFFPDALYPLINDAYAGRPHHFYQFFPYCTEEIKNALTAIFQYIYNPLAGHFDYVVLDTLVQKLLFLVLNRKKSMAFPKLSPQNQRKILEIGAYLKNNPDRLIQIKDLVQKETTTNYVTFNKAYVEVYNESPFHTINSEVMAKALFLLQTGNFSITQVARQFNYYNVHQFSKAFKAFYGSTPTEMLKKYRK